MTTPDDGALVGPAAPAWQQRLAAWTKETEAGSALHLRGLPEEDDA